MGFPFDPSCPFSGGGKTETGLRTEMKEVVSQFVADGETVAPGSDVIRQVDVEIAYAMYENRTVGIVDPISRDGMQTPFECCDYLGDVEPDIQRQGAVDLLGQIEDLLLGEAAGFGATILKPPSSLAGEPDT